jgi:hypothetical protein
MKPGEMALLILKNRRAARGRLWGCVLVALTMTVFAIAGRASMRRADALPAWLASPTPCAQCG